MAIKLNGSTSGSVALDAPADTSPSGTDVTLTLPTSAGSSGQYLQTDGSGGLSWQTVTDTNTQLTAGTAVTLSSSGAIFDSLPSGVRKITIALWEVSTTGSDFVIRIGDSGGIESSGYLSWNKRMGGSSFSTAGGSSISGFLVGSDPGTSQEWSGHVILTNVTGNDWVCTSVLVDQNDNVRFQAGKKSLSAELDRVQIDMFVSGDIDKGVMNIYYES